MSVADILETSNQLSLNRHTRFATRPSTYLTNPLTITLFLSRQQFQYLLKSQSMAPQSLEGAARLTPERSRVQIAGAASGPEVIYAPPRPEASERQAGVGVWASGIASSFGRGEGLVDFKCCCEMKVE